MLFNVSQSYYFHACLLIAHNLTSPNKQSGGFADVCFYKAKNTGELLALKTGKVHSTFVFAVDLAELCAGRFVTANST